MLHNQDFKPPQQIQFCCRNARCKLALESPTDNPRDASYCRSREKRFYGLHCRVCEAVIPAGTSRKRVCGRSKCRHALERHPERFYGLRYPSPGLGQNARANPAKIGVESGLKSGRAWRVVAGPTGDLHPINLVNFPANAAAMRTGRPGPVIFHRTTPPLKVIGGFKFADAPKIHLFGKPETSTDQEES